MTVNKNEILLVAVEETAAPSPDEQAQQIADQLTPEADLTGELVLVFPVDDERVEQTARELARILPDCVSLTLVSSEELSSDRSQQPLYLKDLVGDAVIEQDEAVTVVALAGEQEVRELRDPYAWLWADEAAVEPIVKLPITETQDTLDLPIKPAILVQADRSDSFTYTGALPGGAAPMRKKLEAVPYADKPDLALYEYLFTASQTADLQELTLAS